jgi:hypothetical protein
MRGLALGAALLLALPLSSALATDAGEYTFTVLRDGTPIGAHRFAFDRDGERLEIEEETDIKVRFALIPVYHYQHARREVWENGRALSITGTTDNNGRKFDIAVRPNGAGYDRTVNGRTEHFDPSRTILAWWKKDILQQRAFFSVMEDKIMDLAFEHVGKETLILGGQEVEVERYRMRGDEERDLWFDAAGDVAKVAFRSRGSDIEYRRNEATYRR